MENFGSRLSAFVQRDFLPLVANTVLRRTAFNVSTEFLVRQYLETPKRKWKKRRELRDRIASSAISDYLEKLSADKTNL